MENLHPSEAVAENQTEHPRASDNTKYLFLMQMNVSPDQY